MSISEIKTEILKKYVSVHAFCKAHKELSRASVYLVLAGKYPGNTSNQIKRIQTALAEQEGISKPPQGGRRICTQSEIATTAQLQPPVSQETMAEMLQAIRCSNCRRLNRRECMACRDQTARESTELFERLYVNGEGMEEAGQL